MAKADLAIGAAGTTTWERLRCGLPSIVIAVAANQYPGAGALAAAGLIDYAGPLAGVSADMLRAATTRLIEDPSRLERLSRAGPAIVDGLGAERLAEAILPSAAEELRLRPASPSDVASLFGWVNDPEARRQSLNSEPIAWSEHVAWFDERIGDARCHIFILETPAGLPVGQIRFDLRDQDRVRLSYLLDPVVRGRHWATRLVRLGIAELRKRGEFHIDAEVRTGNAASRKVFERLGFGAAVAKDGLCLYTAATSDFGRIP
jgi:RimJ/RimL family protein N-acetyltransferase